MQAPPLANAPSPAAPRVPTLGVVIRFRNSAATLPHVLEALRRQTRQPDLILGMDSLGTDGSAKWLRAAGATVIEWTQPYHHSRVLNAALRHCPTDLVLILSSHTVLRSPDALERLVAALDDPRVACASAKWDCDPFYSDSIDWQEMRSKGLKFGSIYSNSMGILRRSLWEKTPFDETLITMEDSAWALEQLTRGHTVRRLPLDFEYARSGKDRSFTFALIAFKLAARHGLRVAWLGPRGSLGAILRSLAARIRAWGRACGRVDDPRPHLGRLWAFLSWRWQPLPRQE